MIEIPSFAALHPLIVHFPIALIVVAPLIAGVSITIFRGRSFVGMVLSGVLLTLGTLGAYGALETGEAAEDAATVTPELKELIEAHSDLGEQTFYFALGLTITFWLLIFGWRRVQAVAHVGIATTLVMVFCATYLFTMFDLLQTAHKGGLLVHQHGIHAQMALTTMPTQTDHKGN